MCTKELFTTIITNVVIVCVFAFTDFFIAAILTLMILICVFMFTLNHITTVITDMILVLILMSRRIDFDVSDSSVVARFILCSFFAIAFLIHFTNS